MTQTLTRPPMLGTGRADLKRLILDLLEQDTGDDLSALRARVDVDLTTDVTVDSIVMVNIVFQVEAELGIQIQTCELTAARLRSLDLFAQLLESKLAALEPSQRR